MWKKRNGKAPHVRPTERANSVCLLLSRLLLSSSSEITKGRKGEGRKLPLQNSNCSTNVDGVLVLITIDGGRGSSGQMSVSNDDAECPKID